jgi:hypothetical protein
MSLAQQQLVRVQKDFPGANGEQRPDGSYIVTVPNIGLPAGWNKDSVTVTFVAPVGYPSAKPDCFWTDADLRLANGTSPKNTGNQISPSGNEPKLWFSWHTTAWDPNRDNLLSYVRVILDRLDRVE